MLKANVIFFTLAALSMRADETSPIPTQILTAKKIFISNAGDDCYFTRGGGCARDQYYNQFFSTIKSLGLYQITLVPAEADLVFELSFVTTVEDPGPEHRIRVHDAQYKLTIIDPKTHITLWSFIEHAEPAFLESNRVKNHAAARALILADLRQLIGNK